jgi:hypothetical protein
MAQPVASRATQDLLDALLEDAHTSPEEPSVDANALDEILAYLDDPVTRKTRSNASSKPVSRRSRNPTLDVDYLDLINEMLEQDTVPPIKTSSSRTQRDEPSSRAAATTASPSVRTAARSRPTSIAISSSQSDDVNYLDILLEMIDSEQGPPDEASRNRAPTGMSTVAATMSVPGPRLTVSPAPDAGEEKIDDLDSLLDMLADVGPTSARSPRRRTQRPVSSPAADTFEQLEVRACASAIYAYIYRLIFAYLRYYLHGRPTY